MALPSFAPDPKKARQYELCIDQGATYRPVLSLVDNEDCVTPIDVTGWTFRMQIREKDQDGALIVELTTANGGVVIVDAVNGQVELLIADTVTDAFTEAQFKCAVYDLEAIDALGNVERIMEGTAVLSLNITR